jgi:hypothetical protein
MKTIRDIIIGLVVFVGIADCGLHAQSVLERVQSAERAANQRTCLSGEYSARCNHQLLNGAEAAQVQAAERAANLRTCLSGEYPVLCNHQLLNGAEAAQVQAAERAANLRTCASGEYPALCNHQLLSATEAAQTETISTANTQKAPNASGVTPVCEENGSCYGDISQATGRPKTVDVHGYYRKDGTYVRGHYRSAPRR